MSKRSPNLAKSLSLRSVELLRCHSPVTLQEARDVSLFGQKEVEIFLRARKCSYIQSQLSECLERGQDRK